MGEPSSPDSPRAWLGDERWQVSGLPLTVQLALATGGVLCLELALIRWASGQVRVLAYFNNIILISAFLGLGLGVPLGRRHPGLLHALLPALAVVGAVLGFSGRLGLAQLPFPDPAVSLWGGEHLHQGGSFLGTLAIFVALLAALATVFMLAGAAVGALFSRLTAVRAYGWDLGGSLAGTLLFAGLTATHAPPVAWLVLGVLPFVLLSRTVLSVVAAALVVGCAWVSQQGAVFSAYNRITLEHTGTDWKVSVNRDFHQNMHDFSAAALATGSPAQQAWRTVLRDTYDAPFALNQHRDTALVVAAGTGNDVAAALRAGFGHVVAVDIDPVLVDLGRQHHAQHPYSDPRVQVEINDARAFLEQHHATYDAVVYGLLDSHAMFSSMASLRLDNYVYTVEGLRSAYAHVAPRGHLAISFSVYAGDWIAQRQYHTLWEATGKQPVVFRNPNNHGMYLVVPGSQATLDLTPMARFGELHAGERDPGVFLTTDDWPFLYLRPNLFPWAYLVVLVLVLLGAALGARAVYGRTLVVEFDAGLFFLGAAFMLLEARAVTSLSLLFGSTWVVNSVVFASILLVALLSNMVLAWRPRLNLTVVFVLLVASLLLLYSVDLGALNRFSPLVRAALGGVLHALPVGLAGLLVSSGLAASSRAETALGANLLGSVVGGCTEYLSMITGLRALVLLALVFYLAAYLWISRRHAVHTSGAGSA